MKKVFIWGDPVILKNYAAALSACGAQAVFAADAQQAENCDALLLAGGGDMHPSYYGQPMLCCNGMDLHRDQEEFFLVKHFMQTNRPILGICRGIQVLNVVLGGTLSQDIPSSGAHKYREDTGDQVHPVSAPSGSFLHDLYGGEFSVNSAHHQAVLAPAADLAVCTVSNDGVIEGLQWPQRKLYGVQFHPERMAFAHRREDTVDGSKIFGFFLSLC